MMKTRNTNVLARVHGLSIWNKIFCIFSVLFIHQLSAQLTIVEVTEGSVGKETVTNLSNSEPETQPSKGKIFLLGDAKIYTQNSDNHFEIEVVKNDNDLIASKPEKPKSPKKVVQKREPAKPEIAYSPAKIQQKLHPSQASDIFFSVHQRHTLSVVNNQNPSFAHFLKPTHKDIEIAILVLTKAKISNYLAYFKSNIYLNSSSIRPPPALS